MKMPCGTLHQRGDSRGENIFQYVKYVYTLKRCVCVCMCELCSAYTKPIFQIFSLNSHWENNAKVYKLQNLYTNKAAAAEIGGKHIPNLSQEHRYIKLQQIHFNKLRVHVFLLY